MTGRSAEAGRAEHGARRSDLAAGPVTIWVPGRPRTKGSLKPVHVRTGAGTCKVGLVESGEFSVAWKKTMIRAIREQAICARWPGAVWVSLMFIFDREGDSQGDGSGLGPLYPTGRQYGDVDKLERNALDALTQSGLILDDSLVVDGRRAKRFTAAKLLGDEVPGVRIRVVPVGEDAP